MRFTFHESKTNNSKRFNIGLNENTFVLKAQIKNP